jgi:levanase
VLESITVTPIIPAMWAVPDPVAVPGPPTDVAASPQAAGVEISWNAPSENGGADITEYRVHREGQDAAVASTTGTAVSVDGLVPGSTARFAVSAVNSAGEGPLSAWSAPVTVPDGATAVPARGTLSHDNGWDTGLADGDYTVTMNLWWGQNASSFRLYENGVLVSTVPLAYGGLSPQRAAVPIAGKPNGTYVYTGELVNSKGSTPTSSVTVKVTQANPAKPVLSHDNHDGDGTYTVTADVWWGTNATGYRFFEGDRIVAEGSLVAATPGAQSASLPVSGASKGTHTYRVEFFNAAGSTSSSPLKVTVKK